MLLLLLFHFFRMGHHYIYFVLDWSKPDKAMITVFGTLILAILVHICLFWIYKLRVFLQRRFFATELILPTQIITTTNKDRQSKSSGSQISMVFASNDGCANEAFKTSTSNVFS